MDTARRLTVIANDRGIALVYIALAIFALVACLGLAIDLGHLYVVRGELQNAADASALAGAASLYKDPLNPGATPALDFPRAQTAATNFIGQNKSDGASLSGGAISTGYWNISLNRLESPSIPTRDHVPAVVATISRSAGSNGGPVANFFARVFGADQSAVSSLQAVAVSGYPGAVPSGGLFPLALSSCMTDQYFSQDPLPSPPTTIVISSIYVPGGSECYTGQWTSFQTGNNDVPTISYFMENGNQTPLQTGDDIWIEPGAKASLYKETDDNYSNRDFLMAIVAGSTGNIETHSEMEIVGFATFHIDSANQAQKTVTGHFIQYYKDYPGIRPGGAVSNTVTPPLLVQ